MEIEWEIVPANYFSYLGEERKNPIIRHKPCIDGRTGGYVYQTVPDNERYCNKCGKKPPNYILFQWKLLTGNK